MTDPGKRPAEWLWADAAGAEHPISRRELVASLAAGDIPTSALVWKPGWLDWLPVSRVADFAAALPPGSAERLVMPRVSPSAQKPPPLPLTSAPVSPPLRVSKGLPSGHMTLPIGSTMDAISGQARHAVVPDPPPPQAPERAHAVQMRREPLQTLMDVSEPAATPTLRPPGAVPPPPRGVPRPPVLPDFAASAERRDTPLPPLVSPPPPIAISVASSSPPPVLTPPPLAQGVDVGPRALQRRPAEPTIPDIDEAWQARFRQQDGATKQPVAERLPPSGAPEPPRAKPELHQNHALSGSSSPPPPTHRLEIAVVALGVLTGILAVAVVVLLFHRGSEPTSPEASASAGVAGTVVAPAKAVPPRAPTPTACASGASKKLAESAALSVTPVVTEAPGGGHVAIGFAAGPSRAIGMSVDVSTLDVTQELDESGPKRIHGVVPSTASGKLSFIVDRESAPLRFARSIDTEPRMMVGMAARGFSQWTRGKHPALVWPGDGDEPITEPRVASTRAGHAVTFRRGGQSGKLLVGFIGADGSPASGLEAITFDGLLGTPSIGQSDERVVVAFAGRKDAESPWGIHLVPLEAGRPSSAPVAFHALDMAPGDSAISPAISGLGDDAWLLQWTEGSAGTYRVRVQVVDRGFRPLGQAVTVSPAGANAGQGTLWTRGGRGVSVFVVTTSERNTELWGASLTCQ